MGLGAGAGEQAVGKLWNWPAHRTLLAFLFLLLGPITLGFIFIALSKVLITFR